MLFGKVPTVIIVAVRALFDDEGACYFTGVSLVASHVSGLDSETAGVNVPLLDQWFESVKRLGPSEVRGGLLHWPVRSRLRKG